MFLNLSREGMLQVDFQAFFSKFGSANEGRGLEVGIGGDVTAIRLSLQERSCFHLKSVQFYDEFGEEFFLKKENISFLHSSIYQDNKKHSGESLLVVEGGQLTTRKESVVRGWS